MVTSDNVARERATAPSAPSGRPFWHPLFATSEYSVYATIDFFGDARAGRRKRRWRKWGGLGWRAGYGGRQAASEKCPWSVTTLRPFFLLRPAPPSRNPHRVAARGFGTNGPHVWPRAHSLFFSSFLPSFLPFLPPTFHPTWHRCPASSISQLATGERGKSNSRARFSPES